MEETGKIQSFEQLIAWRKAQDIAVHVYKLTQLFPSEEQFALTNQIRRAATSISANVAEGFGRRSKKDKQHFYTMAYGSLLEVKNFTYLAKRLGYIKKISLQTTITQITDCQKLINALTRSVR